MSNATEHEYEVFGQKVIFRPVQDNVTAREVIDAVEGEFQALKDKAPHLNRDQLMVLTSLKLAGDKLKLEKDYRDNIEEIENHALSALKVLEQTTPPPLA